MSYDDFKVQLEASPDGTCRARVIQSPAGEASGTFDLPLTREELDALAENVAGQVRRRSGPAAVAGGPVAPPEIRAVGARLFRALFSDGVRGRYDESVGRVRARAGGGRGLRLTLHLALDDARSVALLAQPWEFLLRPDLDTFLARGRDTSLVRYVHVPLAPGAGATRPSGMKVLAVPSCPEGLTPLRVEGEIAALTRSLAGLPEPAVETLRPPTLVGLRDALRTGGYHVLHFAGHGAFDERGEGVLCFTDADGRPWPVSGRELAQQVRGVGSLRLVVLNACDSARASAAAPFTGAATALIQAGVPAVIAMQFQITDQAALAFSSAFYARLAAGDAIDVAVAEARVAVENEIPGTLEWGTPVLFMRSSARDIRFTPRLPRVSRHVPARVVPDGTPAASRPAARTLQLAHRQAATLPELGATVSVDFQRVAGREGVGVTLAAPGVVASRPEPTFGPATLEFHGVGRVYCVDVIVIAWQARRVTLRVRTE